MAAAVALTACGSSSREERIVFQAKVAGLYQLFTIKPDGTGLRQITHVAVRRSSVPGVENPAWSPDGSKIAFDSDYGQTPASVVSLFTVEPDGSDLKRIPVEIGKIVAGPAWSADGKSIVFGQEAEGAGVYPRGIYAASADGSNLRALVNRDDPGKLDGSASWSPDARWIAFEERRGDAFAVLKMRANGSHIEELTPWAMNAGNPKWSPDGTRILFNSHQSPQPGQNANVFVMNPDGTGVVQLTHYADGTHQAFVGAWSPDGSKVVYHVRGWPEPDTPGVQNQLYVMNADGTGRRRLTHLPAGVDPSHPSWSPAG